MLEDHLFMKYVKKSFLKQVIESINHKQKD